MNFHDTTLLALLPILFFGLLAPELSRRFKLPYVTILILVGAVMGPNGFNYVHQNESIGFLGFLGFSFLMLMAGLEVNRDAINEHKKDVAILASFDGLLPFIGGFLVTWLFGFGVWPALVVGTVFVSSSVAIVIPTIRDFAFRREADAPLMIAAVVVEEVTSLFLLAVVLQSFSPITSLPLPQYFAALVISVLFLKRVVPRLARRFFSSKFAGQTRHETKMRFVILMLVAVLLYFSFLGVHPIIAAFILGLLLAEVVAGSDVVGKLHTLGYGLFVPVFFFIVGMEMDLKMLFVVDRKNLFILLLVLSFFSTKFVGGYVGGRLVGMSWRSSLFFGFASLPQLTTTLAATYAASAAGLIGPTVVTAILLISLVTTVLSPILLKLFHKTLLVMPVEQPSGSATAA